MSILATFNSKLTHGNEDFSGPEVEASAGSDPSRPKSRAESAHESSRSELCSSRIAPAVAATQPLCEEGSEEEIERASVHTVVLVIVLAIGVGLESRLGRGHRRTRQRAARGQSLTRRASVGVERNGRANFRDDVIHHLLANPLSHKPQKVWVVLGHGNQGRGVDSR